MRRKLTARAAELALEKKTKDLRLVRERLEGLVNVVGVAVRALDRAMKGPSTPARGRAICQIVNALEFEHDRAAHFGLGRPLDNLKRLKETT